jgi:hypothetical protein
MSASVVDAKRYIAAPDLRHLGRSAASAARRDRA